MGATLSQYYLGVLFVFVILCIQNLIFFSTYSSDKCFVEEISEIAEAPADGEAPSSSKVPGSVTLTIIPLILCLAYVTIILFILLGICGIRCFSGMAPEKFGNLGFCLSCCGCFVRNFTRLLRILHILVLILIIVQFILILTLAECKTAKHQTTDNLIGVEGAMYEDAILYNQINGIVWTTLHYVLPCVKSFIDVEAYLYEPYDDDNGLGSYLLCEFFGP